MPFSNIHFRTTMDPNDIILPTSTSNALYPAGWSNVGSVEDVHIPSLEEIMQLCQLDFAEDIAEVILNKDYKRMKSVEVFTFDGPPVFVYGQECFLRITMNLRLPVSNFPSVTLSLSTIATKNGSPSGNKGSIQFTAAVSNWLFANMGAIEAQRDHIVTLAKKHWATVEHPIWQTYGRKNADGKQGSRFGSAKDTQAFNESAQSRKQKAKAQDAVPVNVKRVNTTYRKLIEDEATEQ